MKESDLHEYQVRCVDHIIDEPFCALHLDPGLGKTISTLTAISTLMHDMFEVKGVLVVAPKRVIQSVWKQEAMKWDHTRHLRFSYITGDPGARTRGLCAKADIYLINYENLVWMQTELEHRFLSRGKYPPWDMIVFDESTKVKGTRTRQGVKRGQAALQLILYCPRRLALTGSPAPQGLQDLFGQYLLLDSGRRLGTSFSAFQSTYFYRADYSGRDWQPFEASKNQITSLIGDITIDLRAEDYITMPDLIENDIMLTMPPAIRTQYDNIEREMLIELESGNEVEIFNRASLVNRCLQFAGGGVYLNPGAPEAEYIHTIKSDALDELLEELSGQPALILYQYQHEAKRIIKNHPDAVWLSSKTSAADFNQAIQDWNDGKLTKILAHPASMGHGVDRLQHNCHNIIWFGLNWSYELYYQTNSRIARQGQGSPTVMCHRLMMSSTVDLLVSAALKLKRTTENEVRDLIRQYGKSKTNSPSGGELKEIQCPTCGYYCLGKGGWGCIDKPSMQTALKQEVK